MRPAPDRRDPAVLHESAGVVAVVKPPGLPTQAPAGIRSVEAWLRERVGIGGYVGVPHRLDRAVSGVMLLAVTPRAARTLSRQFERRQVRKMYLAVAAVHVGCAATRAAGEWRDLVEKVPDEPRARIVAAPAPQAREAVTLVTEIATGHDLQGGRQVLLRLEPVTGRMHQLRVQAAHRGLPIVGDALYGETPLPADEPRAGAILLHARSITFTDPDTGAAVTVGVPPPPWWPAWAQAAS